VGTRHFASQPPEEIGDTLRYRFPGQHPLGKDMKSLPARTQDVPNFYCIIDLALINERGYGNEA